MAGIDKLWISHYYELEELRRWAIVYYPKLFLWLDTEYTEESFNDSKTKSVAAQRASYKRYWEEISSDGTINSAVAHLILLGYSEKDAMEEANNAYKDYLLSTEAIYNRIRLAVMNAPSRIDKKLKWICPLQCVREYLRVQCGVKEHWYYKIFCRGKKYFL